MSDLQILALTVAWTWLGLILASLNRSRSWTLAGLRVAFGYRDDVPPSTTFSRRLDRISNNMLENLPLFAAALLCAHLAGVAPDRLVGAAWLFLGARVAYFLIGLAGIPYLRTALWGVGVFAVGELVALTVVR